MRSTIAGLATAFILGLGALGAGSIAGASPAAAGPHGWGGPGWHGGHGPWRHGFHHRRHYGPRWGHAPIYAGADFGPRCVEVMRIRFVPGYGRVLRPVTICR